MRLFRKPAPAPVTEPAPITWPKELSGEAALDDDARLQLINDLGLIGAPWCVPLLERALDQETNEAHLRAVQDALGACRNLQSSA
jgi:hypothetical protein